MATSAQVAEFRQANQALVTLAQRDLADFWAALPLDGDPARVRNILLDFYPDLLTAYGDTAAVLGADWYDLLRHVPSSSASFSAVLASPVQVEQAQASVRWAVGPLFRDDPDPAVALARLMGSTQRLVIQPGRDSIWDSARRDPVRTGVARVPSGASTCRFCIMLASRGAIYSSVEAAGGVVGRGSAESENFNADGSQRLFGNRMAGGVRSRGQRDIGNTYHDLCDCVPTVIRSADDYPEDHDLERYLDLYREGSGAGRDIPTD